MKSLFISEAAMEKPSQVVWDDGDGGGQRERSLGEMVFIARSCAPHTQLWCFGAQQDLGSPTHQGDEFPPKPNVPAPVLGAVCAGPACPITGTTGAQCARQ